MTFDMPDTGPGRLMRYPMTLPGKVFSFPYKHHWKNARGFRFYTIGALLTFPIIYPIHKAVNSPGNVEVWKEIRAKRRYDPFAPPTLSGGHH